MARFCTCWLVCCSLLLPFSVRAAETPVSAEFFLQSIEPEPSATMLHDFLEIYGENFAACKDTETYLRALTYLAANGDLATVRDRLKKIETCTNLSASARQRLAALREQTAVVVRGPLKTAKPGVAPAEPGSVASLPVIAGSVSTPPEKTAPATAGPAESSPSAVAAQATQASPVVPAAQAVPEIPVVQAGTPPPARTMEAAVVPQAKKAHKRVIRRSSLPVTPTIPMPSRIVPPAVLAPRAPDPVPQVPTPPDTGPVPVAASAPAWRTEVGSRAVYRTGHEGTGRLLRLENTATLGYGDWTFSATALYLNAGTAGNNEFAGSYFRGRPQRALLTEQTAFIPQIAYESDTLDISIGSSPLGGEVSPLPTFRLSYTYKSLKLAVFQESVTDSLLSYTGFRDPFTGQRMGRVMKAGGRVGWDDTFAEHWFYGGAFTGACLYGENVKDNTQLRGEFYFGRSFDVPAGSVAVGSYSAADHYSTNLNNYTFGHGGYYSPFLAASSVLFTSWEYAGRLGRIKADVSSGFLYETTRDSRQYYGTDGPPTYYEGETHRRFTVNAGLEGSLNLSDAISLNSTLRVINAGDFTETRGALYVKWVF